MHAASIADPFLIDDTYDGTPPWRNATGLVPRNPVIDTGIRNLVLIWAGQSLAASSLPTLYTPSNSSKVDQFNIYDGAFYPVTDKLLGCSYSIGPGNTAVRVADTLAASTFGRVIIVGVAIDSTLMENWVPGGPLGQRIPVAMRRLALRGVVPGLANVTFAQHWMIGESDGVVGTSSALFQANFNKTLAGAVAAGFSGRTFITVETMEANITSATIQGAQQALPNGTTIFQSGNIDSLTGGTNRQAGGTHLNDTGAASAATLIVNAMHATGAPF